MTRVPADNLRSKLPAPSEQNATVVVVSYRSADVLPDCIASISSSAEVIIVNQDGAQDLEAVVSGARPDAHIISSGRNRGFGSGCNLGAANATGEILVFLNPDARLQPNSLALLVEATVANGGTLIGPRILDGEGRDVTRVRRWSSPWTDAFDLLIPLRLQPKRWRRDVPPDDAVYRRGGEVPYVQGACMAISRDWFRRIGGFDEEFFLFGEEEYLAVRLRCRGLSALLEPRALVTHAGHSSVAKTRTFAVEQYYRTLGVRYRRDVHERDAGIWLGVARSIPIGAVLLFLLATASLRIKISYRENENAEWCRTALRGLIRGLVRRPVAGLDPARISEVGKPCEDQA